MISKEQWNKTFSLMVKDAAACAKTIGVGRAYQTDHLGNMITCIIKVDHKNTKCGYKQYWEINNVRIAKRLLMDQLEYLAYKGNYRG